VGTTRRATSIVLSRRRQGRPCSVNREAASTQAANLRGSIKESHGEAINQKESPYEKKQLALEPLFNNNLLMSAA
jgi:hypothetical protein